MRAPNIQELFATPTVGLAGANDPCAGRVITATDFGCLAQGLVVGQQTAANPAGQYNGLLGGNPDLEPEKATTKTIGVVIQPGFLPRLSITVDYFDIRIRDAIQPAAQDSVLNDCTLNATATFTPVSCSLINRDVAGSLWLSPGGFVSNIPNNLGRVRTTGIEVNGAYNQPIGDMGSLSLSFVGTYLDKYRTDNGLTQPYECAGYYGPVCSVGGTVNSGAPLPKYRGKTRLTWQMPSGIGLSAQWRYIGRVKAETTQQANQSVAAPGAVGDIDDPAFGPNKQIKAFNYIDLASTFRIGDTFNFRLGVNNVFDKQPPLITSGNAGVTGSNLCPTGPCNGNTYPATYEALGRYFYAGVTLDF